MWNEFWTSIDGFLTSSMPGDGLSYHAKTWVLANITEPFLELAYACGIHSYKPASQYCQADEAFLSDMLQ